MSSRNVRLSPEQRRAAAAVYRALCAGRDLWSAGERSAPRITEAVRGVLEEEPLLGSCDYVSLAASDSLEELEQAEPGAMLSTAVHLGPIRLIDNVILE